MRKPLFFAYAKTKTQISCAVTAQLISAFVFATQVVQSLIFLNPKAKFYVGPPLVGGTKVCSRHLGHMTKMAATPIYG